MELGRVGGLLAGQGAGGDIVWPGVPPCVGSRKAASARGGLSPRRGLWLPWPTGLEPSTLERLQEQARGEGITVERRFIQQATLTVTRSDKVKWKV